METIILANAAALDKRANLTMIGLPNIAVRIVGRVAIRITTDIFN
ncbi:MAG: hypothetical protein ACI84K_002140 [Pseudohongiellaceae bacterium]|jgi:hypothetical protein